MAQTWIVTGSLLAAVAVAAGAFGAHGLREQLSARSLEIWHTAAFYHQVHAVALLVVALLVERAATRRLEVAGWLFFGGVVVFSGSLYALALSGVSWLGAITPLGGVALIGGWLVIGSSVFSVKD
jgi:uncharacterized membrane protein YgdD (TMEM256/DUF423 family)